MKRMWMAVAAVVSLTASAGVARADFGGPLPPSAPPVPAHEAGCADCGERYGLNPWFRKALFWKKDKGCGPRLGGAHGMHGAAPAGAGAWGGPPGVGMPGTPGAQMPGTLVFPNHWYVRSPRDFFMMDTRRP